jgi:glycosyltransferase involved in cell wall biosynthesis
VQATMIEHGRTGFLVETQEEWLEAVGRLMHDPELRHRLGQAGRRRVEERFSVQVGAAQWLARLACLGGQNKQAG